MAKVTYGEWGARWLAENVGLKASTMARYRSLLDCHIMPRWSAVPLAKITHADVVGWIAKLNSAGLAPASIRQAHRVFSQPLELAVRDGRLARNPAHGVSLPRVRKANKRFLTIEQVDRLANACGQYRPLVLTLACCGLRWGEAAGLRIEDADLMRRRLQVRRSITEVNGRTVESSTKSHQQRSVPFPSFLVDDLMTLAAGREPGAPLFTSPDGGILRNNNFRRRVFDAAAAEVGLTGLTPHELRHTAASLAVSAGANVKAVQLMLGHASAAMTLDVYAGLFGDDLDDVADRLNAAFRPTVVSEMCQSGPATVVHLHADEGVEAV